VKDDEKGFGQGMGRWNGQGSGEVEAGGEETVWGRKRGNSSEGKKRVSPSAERRTCIVPYVDPIHGIKGRTYAQGGVGAPTVFVHLLTLPHIYEY